MRINFPIFKKLQPYDRWLDLYAVDILIIPTADNIK